MARRIAGSKVNWTAMLERVPENQRSQFLAFKARSDNYLRSVLANPENAPKIDWAAYKNKIPVAGLVDTFQKGYEGIKVAYPNDTRSSEIDAQEKEISSQLQSLSQETADNVSKFKTEIARIEGLIPYSEMTMEEFYQAHPEQAIDTFKNPTFWPHTPEEQLDYVAKDAQEEPSH